MIINKSVVKLDIRKLHDVEKELKKQYQVKVGILGNENSREFGSNASIGAVHEFGSISRNIPERSFLRIPIRKKMPEKLQEIGQGLIDNMTTKNIKNQYKKLGVIGENIVHDAFDTGGFGTWAPNSYRDIYRKLGNIANLERKKQLTAEVVYENKQHTKILVQTGQLEHSITSEVELK